MTRFFLFSLLIHSLFFLASGDEQRVQKFPLSTQERKFAINVRLIKVVPREKRKSFKKKKRNVVKQESTKPKSAAMLEPAQSLSLIHPDYPERARLMGISGRVTLRAEICEQGVVQDVVILETSGYDILDRSAIKSVKEAKFKPASLSGENVASTQHLTLSFELE